MTVRLGRVLLKVGDRARENGLLSFELKSKLPRCSHSSFRPTHFELCGQILRSRCTRAHEKKRLKELAPVEGLESFVMVCISCSSASLLLRRMPCEAA